MRLANYVVMFVATAAIPLLPCSALSRIGNSGSHGRAVVHHENKYVPKKEQPSQHLRPDGKQWNNPQNEKKYNNAVKDANRYRRESDAAQKNYENKKNNAKVALYGLGGAAAGIPGGPAGMVYGGVAGAGAAAGANYIDRK